ncbi:3'-5' exonuclease [Bifidobacterium sp. SO1]|uniref:3'-5' exonuclease n=1 Tax=Bifidobacterium sp. SO1 TaxID=2809029 RepID=UPI001BDC7B5C|nr:3'-5' exonuclease [Bifidobacterium sp. SO1]MBT1162563.1 3'-5' exonuclease [Bifidobacterium sp. SO1]
MNYWDKYQSTDPRRIPPLDAPLIDYVVLDTETTGIDPYKGARLIEIGAVKVQKGRIIDTYSQLINPLMPVPAHITQLTGITTADILDQPTVGPTMKDFEKWLGFDTPILAHNATFDLKFLDYATTETWPNRPQFDHPFLDTLEMSRSIHPEIRHHRVADLIKRYHVGEVEEHRALADAKQEQALYQIMCKEYFLSKKNR